MSPPCLLFTPTINHSKLPQQSPRKLELSTQDGLARFRKSLLTSLVLMVTVQVSVLVVVTVAEVTCRSSPPSSLQISTKLTAPPPEQKQEMMFSLPRVDPVTMTMSPSYSYGWSLSDKVL